MTGSEHERRGFGCDDAYGYGIVGDFVVAAVADGAGSVSGTSAWGSYAACQSILTDALQPRFVHDFQVTPAEHGQTLMRWLFECAVLRVSERADAMQLDASKLSTTLCVALAGRDHAVFGQIGDGIIATENDGRVETLLIEPKSDYANSTWFLQSDSAFEESYRTAIQAAVTAFALSTDGMSYKVTNVSTGEAYEPFFRGSWQHVRSGASADKFAALLRGIEDDQTGDDKTMVLVASGARGDTPTTQHDPPHPIVSSSAPPRDWSSADSDQAGPATDPLAVEGRRRRLRRRWRK
ncbi:protein phosphatase 2C domain-containing protein [Mycolicibacterium moriokaense]|nr:protein phosphatase 2C domain-containing protein [Mycolicibacterium moriokaense]